jgi:uncharacterized protein YydD (DUF2326 family)
MLTDSCSLDSIVVLYFLSVYLPQGQQKLEEKVDKVNKDLKDVNQSLQDGMKRQEEKIEVLMKGIQR